MENTLVLCHGRKHKQIQDIDYNKSIFIDNDKISEPDICFDLSNENWPIEGLYDLIIFKHGPVYLYASRRAYSIAPTIKSEFMKKIINCLKPGGLLRIPCPFSSSFFETHEENMKYIDHFQKLMKPFGFILQYDIDEKPKRYYGNMLEFKYQELMV